MPRHRTTVSHYLSQIESLPFIARVRWSPEPDRGSDLGFDGALRLLTPAGAFEFLVQVKRSHLDVATTNSLIAMAKVLKRERKPDLLLFARYVPRPTGERLFQEGIGFLDEAGNMNLALCPAYHRTILGRPQLARFAEEKRSTPARIRLLLVVAADPGAAGWPVRRLSESAGVSKSTAAEIRREFFRDGLLRKAGAGHRLSDPRQVRDELVSGYSQILRPRLLINRFRGPGDDPDEFLTRLRFASRQMHVRCSLTGGAGADLLQHFYRGRDLALFITDASQEVLRLLRLLPDKEGPVILMRAFGSLVFWREVEGIWIAHPWLLYLELMTAVDPRAHEAAEELRKEWLES